MFLNCNIDKLLSSFKNVWRDVEDQWPEGYENSEFLEDYKGFEGLRDYKFSADGKKPENA